MFSNALYCARDCRALRGGEFPLLDFQIRLQLLVGTRRVLGVERQELLIERRALRFAKNSADRARIFRIFQHHREFRDVVHAIAVGANGDEVAFGVLDREKLIERGRKMFVRPAAIVR